LKEKLLAFEKASDQLRAVDSDSFEEMCSVLGSVEITVPAKVSGQEGDDTTTLLSLLWENKDRMINGVTNRAPATESSRFLYFNIFPKLHIHGLSDNEKVAGQNYRRSFINKVGLEFLSKLERLYISRKKKDSISHDTSNDKKHENITDSDSRNGNLDLSDKKTRSPSRKGRAK
jgi:hypothetical protein